VHCDIERSEPIGSPALGVEAGIRKALLCAAETGELCKASPEAGTGVGAFNLPLRIFILRGGAGDHAR